LRPPGAARTILGMRAQMSFPWLASALVLTIVAGGCSSTRAADDLPREPEAREKALGERLALRDPRTGQDGGAAFLEVTLANPGGERIETRCAPEWYDAKGVAVPAAIDWQAVDLKPGEERRLRFAPMPVAARSWRMRFVP
jgi:uncharacterized protein YcfL